VVGNIRTVFSKIRVVNESVYPDFWMISQLIKTMNSNQAYTYQQIAAAIEHLASQFRQQPSLTSVAEQANLSEFHFQRLFSEWAGVSPKKFSQYLTIEHAKEQLRQGVSLAEAAHQVGLSGTGRLHDLFVTIEGITPGEFKQAGAGIRLSYGVFSSPFGIYVLGAIERKICALQFLSEGDDPTDVLRQAWPKTKLCHEQLIVQPLANQIFPVIGNRMPSQRLHVLMKGSSFQLKVWEALLKIPEGRMVSYDQVALAIGQPTASRAVGTAIGSNLVGYLIPCHRVIKKNGLFGNYCWGECRKQAMLGWEAAQVNA